MNLVATADLGNSVELSKLGSLPHITYNPSRYFCAYYKDDSMEAKVSIFVSGKMIAVGAKSEASAQRDLKHVATTLRKQGLISGHVTDMIVRNVVVTVDMGEEINLEDLQQIVPGIVYEPEQFPGAIFKPISSDVTVLIFASGKMVVAGIKSESQIDDSVKTVLDELNLEQT